MHYYKRNIGDYAKKAGRLSMLQHGSYTLLIDSCYDREEFPTLEQAIEWTWASTTEEIEAVKFVLGKFFTLTDGVYVQNRIQEEITEYHSKAKTNQRIAIERETKRMENNTKRARSVDEPPPNHKPITNNQKPIKEPSAAFALPDWIDKADWELWLKTRKGKKMIPAQMQAQVNKLDKWRQSGVDYRQALKDAGAAGWSGLFEPKKQSLSVQEARLDTARQIQGGIYGSSRPAREINPRPAVESGGARIPEASLFLRESDDCEVAGD